MILILINFYHSTKIYVWDEIYDGRGSSQNDSKREKKKQTDDHRLNILLFIFCL